MSSGRLYRFKPVLTPPKKRSQILRLAMADLLKAEKSPDHKVDMGTWVTRGYGTCFCCLAGSVMAFSLDANPGRGEPPVFPHQVQGWYDALVWLDNIRAGSLYGLGARGPGEPEKTFKVPESYNENPRKFRNAMFRIVRWLEARGE